AVGALAAWAGQELAFGLVAVVSLLGVVLSALAPSGRIAAGAPARLGAALAGAIGQSATRAALALTLIDLLTFGAVDVLVPLHLGAGGTSVAAIAAALGLGAALGAVTGPVAGRMVDRVGPQQVGLITALCIV